MNLGECKIGMLVGKKEGDHIIDVGFIKGITRNPLNEVIVKVEWSADHVTPIHPSNLVEIPNTITTLYYYDDIMNIVGQK